jgi:pyruvate/2-oxoglutarate dehydrogenase complex dihydrolipoamide acyltransferase (E2) component
MRFLTASALALIFGLFLTAPVGAQESTPPQGSHASAAMDAALATHASPVDQQRADLAQLLSSPDVRDLALARGIDMDRVESAAAVLSDAQVKQVAPLVAKVTPLMQRSMGTITISVAAIIIILLILILVS